MRDEKKRRKGYKRVVSSDELSTFHESQVSVRGSKSGHSGVSSRARLFHCTRTGLTPAITANVGNSTVQFLVVRVCVRAHPLLCKIKKEKQLP